MCRSLRHFNVSLTWAVGQSHKTVHQPQLVKRKLSQRKPNWILVCLLTEHLNFYRPHRTGSQHWWTVLAMPMATISVMDSSGQVQETTLFTMRVLAVPRVTVSMMESCGHPQGQSLHNGELWLCPWSLPPWWRIVAVPGVTVSMMERFGHAQGHCLNNGELWPCPGSLSPWWRVATMSRAIVSTAESCGHAQSHSMLLATWCWRAAVCPVFELTCDLMHLFIGWVKQPCSSVVFNQHLMTVWDAHGTTSVKTGWTLVHVTFVWKKDYQCGDGLKIGVCYICVEEGSVISCGFNSAVTCIAQWLLCVWCACTLIPFWAAIVTCASDWKLIL